MRPLTQLLPIVAIMLLPASFAPAQAASDPSGHWEGTIQVPDMELPIEIDLAKNDKGALVGTFTQPGQGIKGLPLSIVAVKGRSVRLVLRPGSGGGTFNATLSEDNTSMAGDFVANEGGYTLSFSLTRNGDARIAPAPKSAPIDEELEGTWHGTLDVGGKQMRLVVTMSNQADGTATGTVFSPDGSGVEIPIAMTQKASSVTIDVPSVGASFAGTLNGTELSGTWTQGPSSLPLTLRREIE
jgi:hypothetical protein